MGAMEIVRSGTAAMAKYGPTAVAWTVAAAQKLLTAGKRSPAFRKWLEAALAAGAAYVGIREFKRSSNLDDDMRKLLNEVNAANPDDLIGFVQAMLTAPDVDPQATMAMLDELAKETKVPAEAAAVATARNWLGRVLNTGDGSMMSTKVGAYLELAEQTQLVRDAMGLLGIRSLEAFARLREALLIDEDIFTAIRAISDNG